MAEIKISDLPDGGAIQANDTSVVVRGGVTFRANHGQVISHTWNRTGNTSVGNKLMIGNLEDMLLAYDVELVSVSIIRTDTTAATIDILNGASVVRTTATSSTQVIDNFVGVACSAGDVISVVNSGGSTVSNCGVTLTFRLT